MTNSKIKQRFSLRAFCTGGVISANTGMVTVRVIHADEEWMIANMVCRVLGLVIERKHDYENK